MYVDDEGNYYNEDFQLIGPLPDHVKLSITAFKLPPSLPTIDPPYTYECHTFRKLQNGGLLLEKKKSGGRFTMSMYIPPDDVKEIKKLM